ncbi:right-handed parallel beta-helix repeat-containing protein [Alicyclobacillus sp. ALC3]|uniref:right-handed parallel beta-helix repeat-containing protein n=1 Tax=Alicyclobacillus sp. ALC3 TaxID=2796143 RepID=UPI002378A287|nr:right-handed parallel beta-helix repeat-containing protein [Alicyclobacillus sp. ALC3]WDL95243.1 right-handed parallel beta-helix repeat-containing protein [Alicyclobacillus sp. ALC3]
MKRIRYFTSVMAAAAVLSTPLWSTVTAQAATTANASTIYVSTTGSDTMGTGTAANPYQTISHAVAVAAPATTIVVEPGTYKESVTITKDVTLESDSSKTNAVANTVIDATGLANGIVVNGAGAAGTVISGLTIENANDHGIWVKDTSNVTVMGNVVNHNGLVPATTKTTAIQEDKPILLDGTAYSVVANNTVDNNMADGGISVTDYGMIDPGAPMPLTPPTGNPSGPPPIQSVPGIGNLVIDNSINNDMGGCGVVVAAYNPGGGVLNNQVVGNTINKIVAGVVVAADVPGTVAKDNIVANNTITNNFIPGVIVHSNTPGDVVDGNVVVGNTMSMNGADSGVGDGRPTGIALIGGVLPVTNTTVANNMISNEGVGIWATNAPTTHLSGNRFASSVEAGIVGLSPAVEVAINGQPVGTLPEVTVGHTTYVSVWVLQQLAKKAGVTSRWNGTDLWFQASNASKPMAPTYLGSGDKAVFVNGVKVAVGRGLVVPTSTGYTTYLPMSMFVQAVNALGYKNSFDGVVWSITQ